VLVHKLSGWLKICMVSSGLSLNNLNNLTALLLDSIHQELLCASKGCS
jgi:hypothetical protein